MDQACTTVIFRNKIGLPTMFPRRSANSIKEMCYLYHRITHQKANTKRKKTRLAGIERGTDRTSTCRYRPQRYVSITSIAAALIAPRGFAACTWSRALTFRSQSISWNQVAL